MLYRPRRAREGRRALIALLALTGLATLCVASAVPSRADYPERPIKLVVGFPAGSGADLLIRTFSDRVAQISGAAVVVENKPGANSNIAADAVAKSRPDGYTVLMGASSNMAGNPRIYKDLPWDPQRDFEPVTTFAQLGFVLVVGAKNEARTVADLTAQLKAKAGKATFGFGNTIGLVASSIYASEAGFQATQVAYKSNPQAVSDVADGQTDYVFSDVIVALGLEKQGIVRILAVTPARRIASLPNVPTMAEAGLPGATVASWWGAYVPAKTPPEVIAKLGGWLNAVVALPETKEALARQGAEPLAGSAEVARSMLAASIVEWERIVKIARIEP